MNTVERITLTLPPDTVRRLDEFADTERRSRSNAAAVLLDRELERIITEGKGAENSLERAGTEAARAHLAAHRRLGGLEKP